MIVLYIIVGFALIITFLTFLITTAFEHKSEILINKPKSDVFEYLKLLKNQDEWSVWGNLDPNMKQEFTGTDGTVGYIETWEGNRKAGKGAKEIKKINYGERVDFELRFEKPFKLTNGFYFATTTVDGNKTKVVMCMLGNSPRPFNLLFPLMKSSILKDFDRGLINLKTLLEK